MTPLPSSASSAAQEAAQEELRQRLPWLDLRCTIRSRDCIVLEVASDDREVQEIAGSIGAQVLEQRGLRRVGRFERGGLEDVFRKENMDRQQLEGQIQGKAEEEDVDSQTAYKGAAMDIEKGTRVNSSLWTSHPALSY